MCVYKYNDLIGMKSQMFDLRLRMVLHAKSNGIKPTAKLFMTTSGTVRKWLRRYNESGKSGLKNVSRRPQNSPNSIPEENRKLIKELRDKTHFGASRLKAEFNLPHSARTINKVFHKYNLIKKRKRKHHKKNDLRQEKAKKYQPLKCYQLDVKYLNDIPQYYRYMVELSLPRFEYTIRDVITGAVFVGYSQSYNMTYSCLFISKFLNHLKDSGIDLSQVIIQTDNGSEFSGTETKERDRGFKHMVEKVFKAKHRFIPPNCPNANADVETFHNLVENEFFDLENFVSREDFFGKISTYQFYFNYLRKNSYKGYKAPVELIRTALPDFDYNRYFSFFPVDLDELLVKIFLKRYTMSVNIPNHSEILIFLTPAID